MVIAASGQDTCPVGWLERYMGIQKDRMLFCLDKLLSEYLRDCGSISYTTIRETKMKYLGYQADKFRILSLRAGGA